MNLSEKLEEAEKVAKANAKAKAEAEDSEKAQQKTKHDELMSRIEPAAEALKRFIEGSEGQAVIRFLRQIDQSIYLANYEPKLTGLAWWFRFPHYERKDEICYYLSGEGLLVWRYYSKGVGTAGTTSGRTVYRKLWIRKARWDDYVNLCKYRALKGEDPCNPSVTGTKARTPWMVKFLAASNSSSSPVTEELQDPFVLIEEIKAEASRLADSLLGSNSK